MAIVGANMLWLVVTAVCLGTILAAEFALRALAPRMADLLEWRDWECQHKVSAIERLAQQGGASVVAIGASDVNAAFDPHRFSELSGLKRPGFNAALNAATMRTIELWALDIVLPKLRPDLVVLGFNTSEMNDNNVVAERGLKMFRSSLGWRRLRRDASFWQRVLVWAEKKSFLVRYRHFLREPGRWGVRTPLVERWRWFMSDVKRLFRRSRGRKAGATDLGMLHALSSFHGSPYKIGAERMIKSWMGIIQDYDVGGHELAALTRLVDSIRETGTPVLIVLMPVTHDWIDLHPHGRGDFERFKRVVDAFVAERDIPFLDLMPEFPTLDEYVDARHCNEIGQARFTARVSDVAADLLGSGARPKAAHDW